MNITERLAKYKVYIDRSRMYIGYINFFMVAILFIDNRKETTFGRWFYEHSIWTFPLLMILFVFLSLLVGYIDRHTIRSAEMKDISSLNPIHMETLETSRRILNIIEDERKNGNQDQP